MHHSYHYKIQLDDGSEWIQETCPHISLVSEEMLKDLRINESDIEGGVTITKVDDLTGEEFEPSLKELNLSEEDVYEEDIDEEE